MSTLGRSYSRTRPSDKAVIEDVHISLAEIITSLKLVIESSKVSSKIGNSTLETFGEMSKKFLDRESMNALEMTELIDSIKLANKAVLNNKDLSKQIDSSKYASVFQEIITNSNISDITKRTLKDSQSDVLSEVLNKSLSELAEANSETNELLEQMLSEAKDSNKDKKESERMRRIKSDSTGFLSKTEDSLSSIVNHKSRSSLEDFAKSKSSEVSGGSLAGSISYVEDMFGVNGASDFLSKKLDKLGFNKVKSRFTSYIGDSLTNMYSKIEDRLPEILKSDVKIYEIQEELIATSKDIIDGIDNQVNRLKIQNEDSSKELEESLKLNKISNEEYLEKKKKLDDEANGKLLELNKRKLAEEDKINKYSDNLFEKQLSDNRITMYKMLDNQKAEMIKDLDERKSMGIISDKEYESSVSKFNSRDKLLKDNYLDAFRSDSSLSLEDYIKSGLEYSASVEDSNEEMISELSKISESLDKQYTHQKELARLDKINKDPEKVGTSLMPLLTKDEGLSPTDKLQKSKDDFMDMSTDFLFDRDSKKSTGGKKGLLKSGKGLLSKATGLLSKGASFAKFLGPVGVALTAGKGIYDGVSGWNDAGSTFGLEKGKEATTGQKSASAVGSLLSGLSFGLLDKDSTAKSIYDFFGGNSKNKEKLDKNSEQLDYEEAVMKANKSNFKQEETLLDEPPKNGEKSLKETLEDLNKNIAGLSSGMNPTVVIKNPGGRVSPSGRNDDLGISLVNGGSF